VRAADRFAAAPLPETQRQRRRTANEIIDAVAAGLGNTRAVCRRCYIHPAVIEDWEEGSLHEEMTELRRRYRSAPKGLDRQEAIVLRWLEAR
jgi:DNA topoisomerase-1